MKYFQGALRSIYKILSVTSSFLSSGKGKREFTVETSVRASRAILIFSLRKEEACLLEENPCKYNKFLLCG